MTNRSLAFVVMVAILCGPELFACSCGKIRSASELINRAPVVFEGVVIRKQPRLLRSEFGWYVGDEWTFRVVNGWKGVNGVTVNVMEGYGNCTNIYELGERAVVFAYAHETSRGWLETSKCSTPVQPTEVQRAELGQPKVSYPIGALEAEGPFRRALRHAQVYLLAGVAVIHELVRDREDWEHPVLGYAFASLLAVCVLGASVLVSLRRTRRFGAKLLGGVALLLLLATFGAGYQLVNSNPYFWHLIERECIQC